MTCECKGESCFYQKHTKTNVQFKKYLKSPQPLANHVSHAPTIAQRINLLKARADKLWPNKDPGKCKECEDKCKCRINNPVDLISTTGPDTETIIIEKWTGTDGCEWKFSGTVKLTTETYRGTCGTPDDAIIGFLEQPSIDLTISSKDLDLLSTDFASKIKKLLEN